MWVTHHNAGPHLALRGVSKAWFWDTFSRYYTVREILSFSSVAKLQWYHIQCLSQGLSVKALLHFEVACCAGTVENSFNVRIVSHDGSKHESRSSVRVGIKISLLNPWLCAAVCYHMFSDALSWPMLTAAASYILHTWSTNRAHTTLARLEESDRDRAMIHFGWVKPQSKHSGSMNSNRHATHTTNTYKHAHLHTHAKLHWESGSHNGNSESWALLCHSEPKSLWHWVTTGLPVCSFYVSACVSVDQLDL